MEMKTMTACFYLITDDGVQYLPFADRFLLGGVAEGGLAAGRAWLEKPCIDVLRTGYGYGISRLPGQQNLLFNGTQLPEGGPYRLAHGDVLFAGSPDMQDYFLLLFAENGAQGQAGWMHLPYRELEASSAFPFRLRDGSWMVDPSLSGAPVKVYGSPLTAEMPVYAGSVFRCGKRLFAAVRDGLFYTDLFPEDPAEDGILHIDIENRSIRKFFFRKKKLIENIHLDVKKGQMVLILGQAGAGKTTFMHAVNGYEKAEGTITYNGKTLEEIRKEGGGIGFVPQGDLLRPGVSVYNTLRNAARLKLAGTENDDPEIIRQKIAATLSLMGLTGKEKDLVSKLSGGEKKRLAVAAEYIGDPKLFFLDEPDSGLDGPSAERLMALLRHIADEGRIVMLISHSPDRAGSMFDRVIVLGKDPRTQCGGLAFYGSYPKTLEFFGVSKLESVVDAIGNGRENRAAEFIGRYAAMQAERGGVE